MAKKTAKIGELVYCATSKKWDTRSYDPFEYSIGKVTDLSKFKKTGKLAVQVTYCKVVNFVDCEPVKMDRPDPMGEYHYWTTEGVPVGEPESKWFRPDQLKNFKFSTNDPRYSYLKDL